MAVIYRSTETKLVIHVVPDGIHPGREVVENPDPSGWSSRPKPRFQAIHVPGEPVETFTNLKTRELNSTRLTHMLDLRGHHEATLNQERTIILSVADVRRKPVGSGRARRPQ